MSNRGSAPKHRTTMDKHARNDPDTGTEESSDDGVGDVKSDSSGLVCNG